MTEKTKTEAQEAVKVVIRRLPKYMTEEELLEQISPLPEEVVGFYFSPANLAFEPFAFSSMYLQFTSYCDALFEFEKRFDGYIFVDSKGNDSTAIVEAATNQDFKKCDWNLLKSDEKCGAIVRETGFKEFLRKVEEEKNQKILTIEQQIRRLELPEDKRTQLEHLETPLVRYLIDKETEKYARRNKREDKFRKGRSNGFWDAERTEKEERKPESPRKVVEKEKEKKFDHRKDDEEKMRKKKERDAARKKRFLEEKNRKREEEKAKPRPPGRNYKASREGPKLGDHVGEDWIKKLTDPKSELKREH